MAGLLAGDPRAVVETEQAVAAAERAGLGWLARVGRAALSIAGTPAGAEYARSDATAVRDAAAREEDRWGEGLAALAEGWAAMREPEAALEPLEAATARFRALGAGSLEAWARGLAALALARVGAPEAREAALGGRGGRALHGHRVVAAVAQRALAELDPVGAGDLGAAADGILRRGGRRRSRQAGRSGSARGDPGRRRGPAVADIGGGGAGVEIRLFGSFAMTVEGRPVDLGGLKPRPRAVLRFLALNAGRPVHREVLQETFWPEADPETGAKNLHVALSALRRELTPRAGRGASDLLVRDGDAYRLALPDGARIDLADFERAVTEARTIRARGATKVAIEALRAAITAYGGDLLPEDGPAEWAAGRRERARAEAVEAARALAELLLDGDPTGAAEACAAGLALDSHHDPLWRILVEARERAGDPAAATSARSGYARMLAELGVAAGDDA